MTLNSIIIIHSLPQNTTTVEKIKKMKCFIVLALVAVAIARPNQSYGGGASSSYGGSSYGGTPAQSQTYSGPNQNYNSQPVQYYTPQVSFIPPQITYTQPSVTYSQPQTISVPQPQYQAVNQQSYGQSYGPAIQMGYQGQASSYGSGSSYGGSSY